MGSGEGHQRVGRLDSAFGLGNRLGTGADHLARSWASAVSCWIDGLLQRLLRDEELLLGHLVAADKQGGGGRRPPWPAPPPTLACSTASSLALLSAGRGAIEEDQRGFEPVPSRGLLRQIGLRDRLVELDDRLPFLHHVALRDEQLVDVPLDGGRQRRDVVGRASQRPRPSTASVELLIRAGSVRTVTCSLAFRRIFRFGCTRAAVPAATGQCRQQGQSRVPRPKSDDEEPHASLLGFGSCK